MQLTQLMSHITGAVAVMAGCLFPDWSCAAALMTFQFELNVAKWMGHDDGSISLSEVNETSHSEFWNVFRWRRSDRLTSFSSEQLPMRTPFRQTLPLLFPSLAFISSWEEEMTHNLEELLLANHSGKHLRTHTVTFLA